MSFQNIQTVFCTVDERPPGRPQWNDTVSFYCGFCKRRHVHGLARRRTEPDSVVGTRVSHCDSNGPRLGEYLLVIGPEQWHPPVRRRRAFGQDKKGLSVPS
jgi:hypothetical protein